MVDQKFTSSLMIFVLSTFSIFASAVESWNPSSLPRPNIGVDCHSQAWSWRFLSLSDENQRAALLNEYIQKCTRRLQSRLPQGRQAEKLQLQLQSSNWPITPFTFHDRLGQMRSGWYLLQDSRQRRPAVVVGCDFECDPRRSVWLKRVIMHLYEEGPFHVVVVQSPEAAPDSPTWTAGGLTYGQAIYETGFWLQTESTIRQKISSLQLMGEGWNAQGTLFALIYNEQNPIASDRKVFQGHLSLCPAVNLEASLKSFDQPANEAQVQVAEQIRLRLLQLQQTSLSSELLGWHWNQNLAAPWLNASLAQSQNREWTWLNPFRVNPPRDQGAWLQANDIAYQAIRFTVPSWQMGSTQDPRFPWLKHGGRLAEQNRDPRKSSLRSQSVEDSSSCAFGASLGWDVEGALWRSLLLSQSFEIWPRQLQQQVWSGPAVSLARDEQHIEQEWLVTANGALQLRYLIGTASGITRQVVQNLDWSLLPESLHFSATDELSAARAQRVLNVRLRLFNQSALINNSQPPTQLQWWGW